MQTRLMLFFLFLSLFVHHAVLAKTPCRPIVPVGTWFTGQSYMKKLNNGLYVTVYEISKIKEGSLADQNGLLKGDKVYYVRPEQEPSLSGVFRGYKTLKHFISALHDNAGKPVTLYYLRPSASTIQKATFFLPLSSCGKVQELTQLIFGANARIVKALRALNTKATREDDRIAIQNHTASLMKLASTNEHCKGNDLPPQFTSKCQMTTNAIQQLDVELTTLIENFNKVDDATSAESKALAQDLDATYSELNNISALLKLEENPSSDFLATQVQRIAKIEDRVDVLLQRVGKWGKTKSANSPHNNPVFAEWRNRLSEIHDGIFELQAKIRHHDQVKRQKAAERAKEEARQAFLALLQKHQAVNLTSSLIKRTGFTKNPYAYQDQNVYIDGLYIKNIGKIQAIISVSPMFQHNENLIQVDTDKNFANADPHVKCVVKVLGTTFIQQGTIQREIPHVKEVECLD